MGFSFLWGRGNLYQGYLNVSQLIEAIVLVDQAKLKNFKILEVFMNARDLVYFQLPG